jgi:hypothetical protein
MANSSEDLSDKLSSDAKKKIKSINPKKVNRFFSFTVLETVAICI